MFEIRCSRHPLLLLCGILTSLVGLTLNTKVFVCHPAGFASHRKLAGCIIYTAADVWHWIADWHRLV